MSINDLVSDANKAYKQGVAEPADGDFFSGNGNIQACALGAAYLMHHDGKLPMCDDDNGLVDESAVVEKWAMKQYDIDHNEFNGFIAGFDNQIKNDNTPLYAYNLGKKLRDRWIKP